MAGPAGAETLKDALSAAYLGNPTLAAQRQSLRATDELVPQALAGWRPTINLSADAGKSVLSTNAVPPPLARTEYLTPRDIALTASQPVYRGNVGPATERAEAQVKAARAQLHGTEQDTLLAAVTAYANVMLDGAISNLTAKNEAVLTHQRDFAKARYDVGEAMITDLSQAEAALSGAHGTHIQAEGNLQADIAAYVNVVGHRPDNLAAEGPAANLPKTLEEAKAKALASNPGVTAQQNTYDAAKSAIDAAYATLLPQATLNGTLSGAWDESFTDSELITAQLLLNVTVPVYQQGLEYSTLRQLKQALGQQKLLLDAARSSTIQATTIAWETLNSAHAQVTSFGDQVTAAQTTLEDKQNEYEAGEVTPLDVLTAAQNLLDAQVNLERARHDEMLASYQLLSAIGDLTAQSLKLSVTAYDPVKHYDEVRKQWIGTDDK